MLPFDAILFDVGGVLLTNGWDHCERAEIMARFHLDLAAFEARHPAPNDQWERDLITLDQYLDATVFYEPRDFSKEEFFAAMCAESKLLDDSGLGILKELATSGKYLVGVLNNEARATNEYRFDHFGLRNYLEVALSSCYLGLRKPEPAIYRRALDILGRPAERILFIDDRTENAAAAAAAGMKVIRFEGADKLRSQLGSFGVF
ncbi:MAG: HAD-IA family hydrolase [Terracidiphilus sp.]